MVRRVATAVAVVLVSDDIERLATRIRSLSSNLRKYSGLMVRRCEIVRSQDGPAATLLMEIPVRRRAWLGYRAQRRDQEAIEADVVHWLNRWYEGPNEASTYELGDFDELASHYADESVS